VCREEGEVFFDRLQKGKYRNLYFQDRDRKIYITK
ncbi:MAG: Histone deacetylase, partial [Thermodesulfobacteriota bacterium]|nr:Histone deacetylase [Thermodesulfobacteriota bacterium]